jgi:glycosyltransferase involved in cell wall biosynthesis
MDSRVPVALQVSIVVPARNEEACLGDCLASLVAQTGVTFKVIVVDDESTDGTRAIAESFAGVRVISAGPRPAGWTGKNNAVIAGVQEGQGEWLLFTDADTVHRPGSLARALAEAQENKADLLSYSPEQVVGTFWERAVMPIIFAELAAQYPPYKVRDQSSGVAAANGQYILCRRSAYTAVGGHSAVADQILEDVALARAFRAAGYRLHFRYAADAVRTRMYRNWPQLREGWTKNLALLFPHPRWLAARTSAWWALTWLTLISGVAGIGEGHWRAAFYLLFPALLYQWIARGNFQILANLTAMVAGPPAFAYLLLRSRSVHKRGGVVWKGRTYADNPRERCGKELNRTSGVGATALVESRH